jgi:hypothetical protein
MLLARLGCWARKRPVGVAALAVTSGFVVALLAAVSIQAVQAKPAPNNEVVQAAVHVLRARLSKDCEPVARQATKSNVCSTFPP